MRPKPPFSVPTPAVQRTRAPHPVPRPAVAPHVQASAAAVQLRPARPAPPVVPAPKVSGPPAPPISPRTVVAARAAVARSLAIPPPAVQARPRPAAPPLPPCRACTAPAVVLPEVIAPPQVKIHRPESGLVLASPHFQQSIQRAADPHRGAERILAPPGSSWQGSSRLVLPRPGEVPGILAASGSRYPFTAGAPSIQMSRFGDILLSGLNLLSSWTVENLFFRIPRLVEHVLSAPFRLLRWFWNSLKTLITRDRTFSQWLIDSALGGAAWFGRLFTKAVDVLGFAEIMDLASNIAKTNTRRLNAAEEAAARVVYGNSLAYWKVRVDDLGTGYTDFYNRIIQLTGGQAGGMIAVTVFHIVELDPNHAPDLNNIVHELGHVKQYEVAGSQYMGEAIHAALAGAGYGYNAVDLINHNLSWFNREQQCRIAEHYWALQTSVSIPAAEQLVPSLVNANLNIAVNAPNAPAGGTPLAIARAIYEPRIQEFRRGQIGGASLVDQAWGQIGRLWH